MNLRNQLPAGHSTALPDCSTRPGLSAECTEHLVLDDCVAACERMAEVMIEAGVKHPLLKRLRECAFACLAYMEAKTEHDPDAFHHAMMCVSLCDSTADECLELDCNTSRDCRRACRACRVVVLDGFMAAWCN